MTAYPDALARFKSEHDRRLALALEVDECRVTIAEQRAELDRQRETLRRTQQRAGELTAALKDMLAAVSPIEHISVKQMLDHHLVQVTDRVRANIINSSVTLDRAGAAAANEPLSLGSSAPAASSPVATS